MTVTDAKIPWLPSRKALARVARHLGCTPEAAKLRIVGEGKGGRVEARGVIEGQLVRLLPADWNGTIDLAGTTMKPPEVSYEITNLELCFIDLIATGLLPAPAEKAWWPAAEAVAYLVKGVPLPWIEWQHAGASPAEIEQAEIDLGQVISEGVPASGWHPLEKRRKPIPSDHFRDEMIEKKAVPVSVAHRSKVVVRTDGNVGTSPPSRIAEYVGPLWSSIEVDSAALRQARPRPLTTQAEPTALPPVEPAPVGPAPVGPAPSSPKLSVQEPPPEEAEQQADPASPAPRPAKRTGGRPPAAWRNELYRLIDEGRLDPAQSNGEIARRFKGKGNAPPKAKTILNVLAKDKKFAAWREKK